MTDIPRHFGHFDCPRCRGAGVYKMECIYPREIDSQLGGMVTYTCEQCNPPRDAEAEHMAKFNRDQDALYALLEARRAQEETKTDEPRD